MAGDGCMSVRRYAVRALRRGLVLAAVFHPKELLLVTAGDDAEVRVWDLMTKACLATLKVTLLFSPFPSCPSVLPCLFLRAHHLIACAPSTA